EHVDDLDRMALRQVRPAKRRKIGDGALGVLRLVRHIQPELEETAFHERFLPGESATSAPRSSAMRVRPRVSSPSRLAVVRASRSFSTRLATSSVLTDLAV